VREITAIGFTPGPSLFHRLDPRTKQALLMGLGAISPWGNFIFLTALSASMLFFLANARVPFGRLIREIRYFLVFLAVVFCLRAVSFKSVIPPVFAVDQAAAAFTICWRLLLVVLMGLLVLWRAIAS
jgi:biotin transport system permease protein/energy-coupling factor transport system permease protein